MFRFGDPGGRLYGTAGSGNANILAYWTQIYNQFGINVAVSGSNGRTTGSCIRFTYGNNSTALGKTLDSQATWGIAFGFRTSTFTACTLLGFRDAGSNQVEVYINTDGTLKITRNGTTLGTTSFALSISTYYHIEFKATIHPSTGTAQLWINGISRLSLTGQNTRNTANSTANEVVIGNFVNGSAIGTHDFDDIIIYDGQTTDANGLTDITGPIGDCGLACSFPTGAGTTTQFTPDSGSNYARVNETTPDITSYVESNTTGNIDTYAMADLPGTASVVKGVAVVSYARKTDVGSRQQIAVLRTGGTNYAHTTPIALLDTYAYNFSNWGQNPNTSAAWTVSDVNGLEAGQKVGT